MRVTDSATAMAKVKVKGWAIVKVTAKDSDSLLMVKEILMAKYLGLG